MGDTIMKCDRPLAMPLARRLAAEHGVKLAAITPAAPDGIRRRYDVERYIRTHTKPEKSSCRILATPLAKRLAAEQDVDLSAVIPAIPGDALKRADVERYLKTREKAVTASPTQERIPAIGTPRATPLAQRLALKLCIALSAVEASNGIRISSRDVAEAAERRGTNAAPLLPRESRRERIRGLRKVIAERMRMSYFLYPTVSLTTDADMKALMDFRADYNVAHEAEGVKISVTDMIVSAVAKALREFEIINASIDGDEIVYHADVNVGVAVALPKGGLLVPVIRGADTLSLDVLSEKRKRLVGAARDNVLRPDDMIGGTFTVTNMGMGGIDSFNPIINYPESAILGVGRTVEKVVIIDGMIAVRPRAVLSLTHDHRLIDGMPASEFLKTVVRYMEHPNLLF